MRSLKGISPFVLIPLVVCTPFLLIGLSEVYKVLQMERSWVSAPGTVVNNTIVAFATGASYAPVVEFRTMEGKTVRFVDSVGTIPPDYEVGTEVKVLYDPEDVHSARVVSWTRLWLGPTILTAAGVLPMLIAGLVVWLVQLKASAPRGLAL
ncbi:MAG: DUF3592 domain-containing protein [Anaerolineae bacterium]|nr:DUF3592 domain-containing protein [Anaerolineae bacterium]